MVKKFTADLLSTGTVAKVAKPYDIRSELAESLTGLATTRGNSIEIESGYNNLIESMIKKIKTAQDYIYVEFFVMALDDATEPFFNALGDAVKRGVKVHLLFDSIGSKKYPRYKEMKRELTNLGIKWYPMLPISLRPDRYNRPDLRNHRKILVIDNTDAYMGSLNMIHETYHRKDDISYIELMAHIQGPSVNEAASVFASDWYSESGEILSNFIDNPAPIKSSDKLIQILPSGPSYIYQNNLKMFTSLIQSSRKSVIITNPYLVPDESLLSALISAAQRGVRVSILNSEAMDQWMVGHAQRSYYEELIRAGVIISLYKKPQLVHEKYLAVDEEVAIIGSSNFDIRSFELNYECGVVAYDAKTAKTLTKHHNELLTKSRQLKLSAWLKRSAWQSFLDSIARLTSALQ